MIRTTRTFIGLGSDYQPFTDSGATITSFAASVLEEHENRPDSGVGRLHYSLRLTLSAHFR
jgi:hypothetical protein